eukprot:894982-Amphidinium_carterae.1
MLSGRSTAVLANEEESVEEIVTQCCIRLRVGLRAHECGTESLLHGTEVVPATAQVRNWPGLRPQGE